MDTNKIIDDKVLNKIIRKKEIWAKVKLHEQEYGRIQRQINDLEQAKKDISFKVQKLMDESQRIAEWFDQQEYEALKAENQGK